MNEKFLKYYSRIFWKILQMEMVVLTAMQLIKNVPINAIKKASGSIKNKLT